jgi:hypothetical protein
MDDLLMILPSPMRAGLSSAMGRLMLMDCLLSFDVITTRFERMS